MEARTQRPRFWIALQPSIVRLYKIAGLVALTAILVGLISFLIVNVFYFFDHSWVRPVVLTKSHQKVVEAQTQLADAKLRASTFTAEKVEIEDELVKIDHAIKRADKLAADLSNRFDAPKTPEEWLVHIELDKVLHEKEDAVGRRTPLQQRLEALKLRMEDQDKLVSRLAQSPYLKAIDHRVVLAFVPYDNKHMKVGAKLYGCAWGLVMCSNVGKITAILDGEVTNQHPNNESTHRGQLVEIDVSEWAAGQTVLFAGSKPLWLF
ncbi:MAG TPA: hypothetical protein VN253_10145 [Kofleriaceae bacterium]|nr:hypothetical protein [Kofleriaceae bacterium]